MGYPNIKKVAVNGGISKSTIKMMEHDLAVAIHFLHNEMILFEDCIQEEQIVVRKVSKIHFMRVSLFFDKYQMSKTELLLMFVFIERVNAASTLWFRRKRKRRNQYALSRPITGQVQGCHVLLARSGLSQLTIMNFNTSSKYTSGNNRIHLLSSGQWRSDN